MIATDEILDVSTYARVSGEILVKCPHCQTILVLEDGDFKGEQFTHKLCGGWFEVSHDAKNRLELPND